MYSSSSVIHVQKKGGGQKGFQPKMTKHGTIYREEEEDITCEEDDIYRPGDLINTKRG